MYLNDKSTESVSEKVLCFYFRREWNIARDSSIPAPRELNILVKLLRRLNIERLVEAGCAMFILYFALIFKSGFPLCLTFLLSSQNVGLCLSIWHIVRTDPGHDYLFKGSIKIKGKSLSNQVHSHTTKDVSTNRRWGSCFTGSGRCHQVWDYMRESCLWRVWSSPWKVLSCWERKAEHHSFFVSFFLNTETLPWWSGPCGLWGKGEANNGRTDNSSSPAGKNKNKWDDIWWWSLISLLRVEMGVNTCEMCIFLLILRLEWMHLTQAMS